MWTEPKAVAGVKLPKDLHRKVRTVALAAGKTTEAAYQEALEQWLSIDTSLTGHSTSVTEQIPTKKSAPAGGPRAIPDDGTRTGNESRWAKHSREYDLLEFILEEGSAKHKSDIVGNLEVYALSVRFMNEPPGSELTPNQKAHLAKYDRILEAISPTYQKGRSATDRDAGGEKPRKKGTG